MFNSFTTSINSQFKIYSKPFFHHLAETLKRFTACFQNNPKKLSSCSSFTSASISNQYELVFKVMDSDGDGKISSRELSEAMRRLGRDVSRAAKEAEEMVREMDGDGDGFVDLDEFLAAVIGDEEDGVLMDAFGVFDEDKNGLISAEELQRVLVKLGMCEKRGMKKECKRMIEGVDRDGDGFVNFDEFRIMMMMK